MHVVLEELNPHLVTSELQVRLLYYIARSLRAWILRNIVHKRDKSVLSKEGYLVYPELQMQIPGSEPYEC